MNNKKIIGSRINSALAMNNTLQKELAKQLNVKDNIVSYWCKGERTPNTSQIIQIANCLNVSTDYLLGLSDVATNDKDLQFICDYIGLSAENVTNLNFVKRYFNEQDNEHKKKMYDLLNNLVTHSYYQLTNGQSLHNLYIFTCLLKKEIKETDYNALEHANIFLNSYLYSVEQDYKELIYDLFEIKEAKAEINKILTQSPKYLEEIEETHKKILEASRCKDFDELKTKLGLDNTDN